MRVKRRVRAAWRGFFRGLYWMPLGCWLVWGDLGCWEAARIELLSREGERVHLRTVSLERRSQLPESPKAESELLFRSVLSRV